MTRTSLRRMAMRMLVLLVALSTCHTPARPAEKDSINQSRASLSNATYRPFLINNVFNYYGNNGSGSYNRRSYDNEGFEFPIGTGRHMIYQDGMLWGGKHKGRVIAKVGGSMYRQALQAGPLLGNGTVNTDPIPADSADPRYRTYAVRPDIRPDIPFSAVEAMLNFEEVSLISRYEAVTARVLYDRYIADWNDWPAADGAPFKDVNGNGSYEPAVDIPGQPGADQTLWYVANDMDPVLTQSLAGCPPLGIEVQRTIWGYRRGGAPGNTIFISTVVINKSGAPVDSMYFAQWADPDVGNAGDDFAGCDTSLDLGYVYNGEARDDVYGFAVPAGGFAFIQGPMVPGSANDTALFLSASRPGFRNLGMSAFALFHDGPAQYATPAQGASGDEQWYRVMRGTTAHNGVPFVDPDQNLPTKFCLSGDPVRATDGSAGWVDGQGGMGPKDRALCMVTGPFTLAHGDTQQVVVACLASQGTDRLSSVTALRSDVRALRNVWRNLLLGRHYPPVSCDVTGDSTQAAVTFRVSAQPGSIASATIDLVTIRDVPVGTLSLADDGLHGDGLAGDGMWVGAAFLPVQHTGMKAGVLLTYPDGETIVWHNVLDHIATATLTIASPVVVSDNINSDGVANPGENVRYTFSLRNDSPLDMPNLVTTAIPGAGNGQYFIGTLASQAVLQAQYDANDPKSYMLFDVPVGYTDSTFRVALFTTDDSANIWHDTLAFSVKALPGQVYGTPLQHVAGKASGDYRIQIVDPEKVKDHLYVIRGADSAGTAGMFTLKDSTTGAVLLDRHPVPDMLGHTIPVVDGFKVLKGTIDANPGMRSWDVPQGALRFSPDGGFSRFGLEGFGDAVNPTSYDTLFGTIGAGMHFTLGGIGTTLAPSECHTVLLKLATVNNTALWDPKSVPVDPNFSRAYRYLRASISPAASPSFVPWIINKATGYPYQDYNFGVPFSAWDMDTDPPTRLAVGHFETNATTGLVDGRYWPTTSLADNSMAREFAFIFKAPYTDIPDTALMVNLSNNATTPLMWVMTCSRRAEEPWPGSDQFLIEAYHFPTSQDAWVFNPSVVAGVKTTNQPTSFALMQNYPNPFNPSTTIRYELPAQGMVTVTVFDVLGRAVRHLVKEVQPAGSHAVLWRGDTDTGIGVASGVYFYRCTVERSDRRGQFDQTMKMVHLK